MAVSVQLLWSARLVRAHDRNAAATHRTTPPGSVQRRPQAPQLSGGQLSNASPVLSAEANVSRPVRWIDCSHFYCVVSGHDEKDIFSLSLGQTEA